MKNNHQEKKPCIEPIWHPYLGREVMVDINGTNIFGLLRCVNSGEGYADFLPSIVTEADGSHVRLEREIPTRVTLPLLERDKAIFRPIGEGYLEKRVKYINTHSERSSARIGFAEN